MFHVRQTQTAPRQQLADAAACEISQRRERDYALLINAGLSKAKARAIADGAAR